MVLETAIQYAQLGFQVIPLVYKNKIPHAKYAPEGLKNSTADESTIRSWFAGGPINIGIRTGAGSQIDVLDIDGETGQKSLAALVAKHGDLPRTPYSITGNGVHYLFKHSEGVRNSASKIAEGIDVRGEGGYIVAPPSIHPSGQVYRWGIDPRTPIADWPGWLLRLMDGKKPRRIDSGPISEGARDNTLTSVAGAMRGRGLDEEAIYAALSIYNAKNCKPPLADADIRRISHSVCNYPPNSEQLILDDDQPDTIARAFETWSRKTCGVLHRWNQNDGWTIYQNDRYQTVDQRQIMRYLSEFVGKCTCMRGKKIERISLSRTKLNDIITQLSYLPDVYLLPNRQSAPCSLDGSLDPDKTIAVANGILDWSTWPCKLHPCTPNFYTTQYLPYKWDGKQPSELWLRYLVDVTEGDIEVCQLLQQWAGYCLMRHDQRQQSFLLLQGEAGTGKSIFVDVLTQMLGKQNVSAVPLEMFDNIHVITQTYGKLLNVSEESDEALLKPSIENNLKHFTGETLFQFKRLYSDPFEAYPTAKILICTNHLPKFKDTSEGVLRRMKLVQFNHVFRGSEKDSTLKKRIIATEMPGVLYWAIEGAFSLQASGQFIEPKTSAEGIVNYKKEMFPELTFFEEHLEATENEALFATCKQVRNAYEMYCKEGGFGVKNDKNFGKALKKKFPNCERKKARRGGTVTWIYYGIKIKTESEYLNLGDGNYEM
jgi:putative DNA primase/helicase